MELRKEEYARKGEGVEIYLPAMKNACGSPGVTRNHLEHVLRPEDDADGGDMGDSDVVEEKKEGV